ncbi:hypothetical protein L1987_24713 [Smallanthus sonchifolius]|uniref:Uncharacterized protein n=1 Tax=Smallanthus sonchifolius TaxID=185202 RepID=A0ACB9INV2_9ASTR|nr:hypothetical protein L1987_24713 [Smallanthus sonchifolius]
MGWCHGDQVEPMTWAPREFSLVKEVETFQQQHRRKLAGGWFWGCEVLYYGDGKVFRGCCDAQAALKAAVLSYQNGTAVLSGCCELVQEKPFS